MSLSTAIGGVVLRLPVDETAPARARAAVREHFAAVFPASALEAALLVTSEIVSNTVVHGGLEAHQAMRLRLCDVGDAIGVEVADDGAGFPLADLGGGGHGGRGLRLIDLLSRRWGVTSDGGTTMWAEIPAR